jgi:hypothetical protein
VRIRPNPLLIVVAVGALVSGCSIGGLATNRSPSAASRLVQHWGFAEFARDIEGKAADVRVAITNTQPAESPVVLVPAPAVGRDVFADMKRLSRDGDEVSEFRDVLDGRYFFCLMRDGRIVKSYEFENRAQPAAALARS